MFRRVQEVEERTGDDVDKIERWLKEMKTWKIRNTSKTILNQEPKPVVSMDTFKVTQKSETAHAQKEVKHNAIGMNKRGGDHNENSFCPGHFSCHRSHRHKRSLVCEFAPN